MTVKATTNQPTDRSTGIYESFTSNNRDRQAHKKVTLSTSRKFRIVAAGWKMLKKWCTIYEDVKCDSKKGRGIEIYPHIEMIPAYLFVTLSKIWRINYVNSDDIPVWLWGVSGWAGLAGGGASWSGLVNRLTGQPQPNLSSTPTHTHTHTHTHTYTHKQTNTNMRTNSISFIINFSCSLSHSIPLCFLYLYLQYIYRTPIRSNLFSPSYNSYNTFKCKCVMRYVKEVST